MDTETIKKQLAEAMKGHDWNYEYSDDMRWWRAGSEQRRVIDHLFNQLNKVDRREALLFWNMHAPANKQCLVDC